MLVQRADLGDRNIVPVGDPVLQAHDHPTLVLKRHGIADANLQLQDADGHGWIAVA